MHNASMSEFATLTLQGIVLDRPVLDRTGLAGKYDFTLTWTPDESQFGGISQNMQRRDDSNAPPSLSIAIQEQIGLKLTAASALADVLVIDHAERPSAN